MLLTRREAICGYGGGLALLAGLPAFGQAAYPSRTIKMIVPYPAGGTTDFLGHLIADQLKTQLEISLDKRKIHLEQPIRTPGEHEVQLRLHPDVSTTLKVRVDSTTPLPETVAAPVTEGRKEEQPRTEKRGRRPEGAPEKTAKVESGERKPRPARVERPQRPDKAPKAEKADKTDKENR